MSTRCSYCGIPGHKINKCDTPSIREMDETMMEVAAITQMFPQIGDLFIETRLKRLTSKQLQAITYLFIFPNNKKHCLKNKQGRIEILKDVYYKYSTEDKYSNNIRPYLIKVYEGVQFSALNPNPNPDTILLRECATIAYRELFTKNPVSYYQISSWIAEKIENYFRDYYQYCLFMESQEFTQTPQEPHTFDILCFAHTTTSYTQDTSIPFDCPICQEEINEQSECVITNCNHKYCTSCITNQLEAASTKEEYNHPKCALCRSPMNELSFSSHDKAKSIHEKYINNSYDLYIL
jgi:hypothetical protein